MAAISCEPPAGNVKDKGTTTTDNSKNEDGSSKEKRGIYDLAQGYAPGYGLNIGHGGFGLGGGLSLGHSVSPLILQPLISSG